MISKKIWHSINNQKENNDKSVSNYKKMFCIRLMIMSKFGEGKAELTKILGSPNLEKEQR